jgi:hypothetical protein
LSRAFEVADAVSPLQFEEKGLLTAYLCVVLAGTLEESVRLHVSEYARIKAHPYIASFVTRRLRKTTNLNSERLIDLLGDLDSTLSDDVRVFLDDRRKSALNSLMQLRHKVAHGRATQTSLATVKGYRDVIIELLDHVDALFQELGK